MQLKWLLDCFFECRNLSVLRFSTIAYNVRHITRWTDRNWKAFHPIAEGCRPSVLSLDGSNTSAAAIQDTGRVINGFRRQAPLAPTPSRGVISDCVLGCFLSAVFERLLAAESDNRYSRLIRNGCRHQIDRCDCSMHAKEIQCLVQRLSQLYTAIALQRLPRGGGTIQHPKTTSVTYTICKAKYTIQPRSLVWIFHGQADFLSLPERIKQVSELA